MPTMRSHMAPRRVAISTRIFERRSSVLTWVGGRPVLVARVDGKLYGMDAVCAHMGCALLSEVKDHSTVCPAHEARYDVRSGQLLEPPKIKPEVPCEAEELRIPLRTYRVTERDGLLEVDL